MTPQEPQVVVSAGDFFTQKLKVGEVKEHSHEYCRKLCVGKKVLHIGCSDYPIFDPKTNMHLYLTPPYTSELHGCDPNGIDTLRQHYNGIYYNSISDVVDDKEWYDTILVPNVIEHLVNPGLMAEELFAIKFRTLFVLVPNYSISSQATYENGIFTEKIHPDHFCWYSPYTLYNLFKKPIERTGATFEMNFFDNGNMISILIQNENIQF